MLNMFDVLLFKTFFGEIQVGLLNKINKFFVFFLLSASTKGGSFDNRESLDWPTARDQSEQVTSSSTWDKKGMGTLSEAVETDSDPRQCWELPPKISADMKWAQPKPNLRDIWGALGCYHCRGQGFYLQTVSTLRGYWAVPCPSRWHHTIVLLTPKAFKSAHSLHSI